MPLVLPPRPQQPSPSLVNDSINDNSNGDSQINSTPEASSMSKKHALDDAVEPPPEAKRKRAYKKRTPKPQAPSPAPEVQTAIATAAPVTETTALIPESQVPSPVAPSRKPQTKKKNKTDLLGYTEEQLAAAQQMLFNESQEIHAVQPQPLTSTNTPPSPPSRKCKLDEATGPSNEKSQRMSNDPSVLPSNALGDFVGLNSSNTSQIPATTPTITLTPATAKKSPAKARKSPANPRKSLVKKASQQDINPLNRYPSILPQNHMGQQTAGPISQYLPAFQHGQIGQQNFTPINYTISPSQHLPVHNMAGSYNINGYNNNSYGSTLYGYSPAQQQQARVGSYAIPNPNTQFNYGQTQPMQQLNGNTTGSGTMSDNHNSPYASTPYASTPYSYSPMQHQQARVDSYAIPNSATPSIQGQIQPVQQFSGHTAGSPAINGYQSTSYSNPPYNRSATQQQQQQARVDSYTVPHSATWFTQGQTQPKQQFDGMKTSPLLNTSNNDKVAQQIKEQQEMMPKMGVGVVNHAQSTTAQSDIGNTNRQPFPNQVQLQDFNDPNSHFDISQFDVGDLDFGNPDMPLGLDMAVDNGGLDSQFVIGNQQFLSQPDNGYPNKQVLSNQTQLQQPSRTTSGSYWGELMKEQQQWPVNQPVAGNLNAQLSPRQTQLQQLGTASSSPNYGGLANGQNPSPRFGMTHLLPPHPDYFPQLQQLQENIRNNTFPKSSIAPPNAGNNPQPKPATGPAPSASPHPYQQGISSNVPTNSGMMPMPSPQSVGQTPGHNPPAKSCMKPLVPSKSQDTPQKPGTKSGMKPLLPPKPQDVPQSAGTNPPLKSSMKPLLPPKPQDIPQKAGINPPTKSEMKPLLPPKPQDVSQKAGTNPPTKSGMKPLLPPKPQPTAQPKNSMAPTLPGAVKGAQSSTYYPAQSPQHTDASAGRTYYPPKLPATTDRNIGGVRSTPNPPQPPTSSPGFIATNHKALGISYADASRMGPNMQQVLGYTPNAPVASRSSTTTPDSGSHNTPAVVYPPPKKVVPYATVHAERASYRGGALMYEVPPSAVMARGYGGSASTGGGSLRPLDFVAQDPPPGYGSTATRGYVEDNKTAPPTAQAAPANQQRIEPLAKPPVQRDAFPYFFETLMAEGSVASVTLDKS